MPLRATLYTSCILISFLTSFPYLCFAENRDKLPNETRAKNEELVNGAPSLKQSTAPVRWLVVLVATLVAVCPNSLSLPTR